MIRVLGHSRVPILRYDVLETNADNLVSDVVRQSSGVDLGFTNGFRFAPPIPAGVFTEKHLWDLLPMDARIKKGWITGRQLTTYLERELELVFSRDPWKLSGGWGPRASGLDVVFRAYESPGKRVQNIRVHGEPLEADRRYSIAGCEREGEPIDVVCRHRGALDVEFVAPSIHTAIHEYFRDHPAIAPRRDGRARGGPARDGLQPGPGPVEIKRLIVAHRIMPTRVFAPDEKTKEQKADDRCQVGLLPISWSSDNGSHLFVDSVDEGSGGPSSIGTYLTQVAENSAGVL